MITRRIVQFVLAISSCLLFNQGIAQSGPGPGPGPGPGIACPACLVNVVTGDDLKEVIADLLDLDVSAVTVEAGDAPGTFRVTLPDGSEFMTAPVGPVFRHQSQVQRQLLQTLEGGLHLRSRTRAELQLRSAVHREAAVIGEMSRLGWTGFYWFRHGMEVEAPSGERYCFQPDMQVSSEAPPAAISVSLDAAGHLVVLHPDGIRQRLHACAHDLAQLRDHVRETVQQQLLMDIDGTFTLEIDGDLRRFRLEAQLHWSGITGQPGFIVAGDRIHLRYRDGWEQEIVELE